VIDRRVRASAVLAEAHALGLTMADLLAVAPDASAGASGWPTVAAYVEEVASRLSPGTAATHRSYWRLAVILGMAGVAGVLAAAGPARLNALEAIASE
jgi:hypothetical protein